MKSQVNEDMTHAVRCFVPEWHPAPAPATHGVGSGRLLVLVTEDEAERAVRRAVTRHDASAALDVVRADDRLVPALRHGPLPERILIWRGPAAGPAEVGGFAAAEREFALLHELTRELLSRRPEHDIRLLHAYAEDGGDGVGVRPEYAAAGAFARVVRLKKPSFRYRGVALSPATGPADAVAEALLAEFDITDGGPDGGPDSGSDGGDAVEIRLDGASRAVRRLRALPPPAEPPPPGGPLATRPGGTYLVTGGLGGLGLVVARELARQADVGLLLTGRRPLDDAGRAALAELEAVAGARARYVAADVATSEGVETLLRQAHDAFGPLNGVVHAAGVLRDALLPRKTPEDAAAVLAAKVRGTRLLDEALREEPLDF